MSCWVESLHRTRGVHLLKVEARGKFAADARFAGPSVLDDRIHVGSEGDTLLRLIGYRAISGDELAISGTMAFTRRDDQWMLEPARTELRAKLLPAAGLP